MLAAVTAVIGLQESMKRRRAIGVFVHTALTVAQGWCVMPNTWNYRIPVVTERKPTADELYLQALKAKHDCIIGYTRAGCLWNYIPLQECMKEFDEAVEHYKKLAW